MFFFTRTQPKQAQAPKADLLETGHAAVLCQTCPVAAEETDSILLLPVAHLSIPVETGVKLAVQDSKLLLLLHLPSVDLAEGSVIDLVLDLDLREWEDSETCRTVLALVPEPRLKIEIGER